MSFQRTVLNAYKSKFTQVLFFSVFTIYNLIVGTIFVKCILTAFLSLQFVMFYACALDPEGCGVKFAMLLVEMFGSDVNPPITR